MTPHESFLAKREARKLAKRLEKERIRIEENLYVIEIENKLWLLEAQNAPFYLASKCLRCGKRRAIIKQSGYCVRCHILYSKELVTCPVYAQLKQIAESARNNRSFAGSGQAFRLSGGALEGKCSALRDRFSRNEKFGDFLIAPNATKCPHCNTRLICSKCGHQIPIHLESCYHCDDKRSFGQKLTEIKMTRTELSNLIKGLPEGTEVSDDEFVSEALMPASSAQLDFETLLYLLENKLPNGEPISTFSIYCAIKEALEQEPLNPFVVDFYRGSGWLPTATIPVRIEPPFMQKATAENQRRRQLSEVKSRESGFEAEPRHNRDKLREHAFGLAPVNKKEVLPVVIEHEVSKFSFWGEKRDQSRMRCFNIVLSNKDDMTPQLAERFWSALNVIRYPVGFEIVGNGSKQKVVFQLICQEEDKDHIAGLINASFPTSAINEEGTDCDYLLDQLGFSYQEKLQNSSFSCFGVSFGLGYHWSRLIRKYTSFSPDPLTSIIGILGDLNLSEGAILQAIVMPAKESWTQTIERLKLAKDKIKYPLFAVSLKAMIYSELSASEKLQSILAAIEKALSQYQSPSGNCITREPLLSGKLWQDDAQSLTPKELVAVCERNTYRFGFLANSQELAGLCHFPSKAMQHPKLKRAKMLKIEAPQIAKKSEGLAIGINEVFGRQEMVYIPEGFRFRHVYIVGKTGTGKTTLLLNMIKGDIKKGKGVGLIDPHGDLVEKVLEVIPEDQKKDLVYFDPTAESPLGFNLLQVSSQTEKRQVKNDLMTVFSRLFSSSSSNVDLLLRMTVSTLLEDTQNTYIFADLRKLITDELFRAKVLKNVSDDYTKEFWSEDFPDFHPASVAAVKRRLADIMSEARVRKILSKKDTDFDFKKIMDKNKIFLANLSRGILGEDVSTLFGGLLVSKIQLTAMARAAQPEEKRTPFYLYVDEFQNFVNDSFEVILSEARKYKLCLVVAHQFTGQLPNRLYDAVFGNVGTLIVFEVGISDAQALEKQLGIFTKDDIINLSRFHTFTRIGKARDTFSMRTLPPPKKCEMRKEGLKNDNGREGY